MKHNYVTTKVIETNAFYYECDMCGAKYEQDAYMPSININDDGHYDVCHSCFHLICSTIKRKQKEREG